MPRPTTEFTLRNGWKVWLVDYFSQGDVEEIAKVVTDKISLTPELEESLQETNGVNHVLAQTELKASIQIERYRRAKELAVRKLVSPDGTVFEGDTLNLEVILEIPHDPEGDQITALIEEHCYPKKKVNDETSSDG